MSRYEPSNDRLGILHGITISEDSSSSRYRRRTPPIESSHRSSRSKHHSFKSHSSLYRRHHSPSRRRSASPEKLRDKKIDDNGERIKATKFRFKKKSKREFSDGHHHCSEDRSSKRHKTSYHRPLDEPTAYDDSYIPNEAAWNKAVDEEVAFRESLFDAMADDEGAAFWEGVYGQPVHVYERPTMRNERGQLETMTDEEYAAYVREKMWEKSHQHILKERERIKEEKEKRRQRESEERKAWEEKDREQRWREKLAREQRKFGDMKKRWKDYLSEWKDQMDGGGGGGDAEMIPWPVVSGKRRDVTKEAVEGFMRGARCEGDNELLEVLKAERVRWHPDKAQQRWGGGLNEERMRAITVCFQAIDEMHKDMKSRMG